MVVIMVVAVVIIIAVAPVISGAAPVVAAATVIVAASIVAWAAPVVRPCRIRGGNIVTGICARVLVVGLLRLIIVGAVGEKDGAEEEQEERGVFHRGFGRERITRIQAHLSQNRKRNESAWNLFLWYSSKAIDCLVMHPGGKRKLADRAVQRNHRIGFDKLLRPERVREPFALPFRMRR